MRRLDFFPRLALIGLSVIGLQGSARAAFFVASANSSAYGNTCMVASGGGGGTEAAYCWGNNVFGQTGNGTTTTPTPTGVAARVIGLKADVAEVIPAGYHTCARLISGGVKCWGMNYFGQLGDGTTAYSSIPVDAAGIQDAIRIAVGNYHSCALLGTGNVQCWGEDSMNAYGNAPVTITGLPAAADIVATAYTTCALLRNGGVQCWGENSSGGLGDGTTTSSATPVTPIGLGSGIKSIWAGGNTLCAVSTNGIPMCWGSNAYNKIDLSSPVVTVPTPIGGLTNIRQMSPGSEHNCALSNTGALKCWGNNAFGQFGNGTTTGSSTPISIATPTLGGYASLSINGDRTVCGVTSDMRGYCWGMNDQGQVGSISTPYVLSPHLLP